MLTVEQVRRQLPQSNEYIISLKKYEPIIVEKEDAEDERNQSLLQPADRPADR